MRDLHEIQLPETLSGLIRVAIEDARALGRKSYEPECALWHSPGGEHGCRVCLAGAVIAGTLGASPNRYISPDYFILSAPDIYAALKALDSARQGNWHLAASKLHIKLPLNVADRLGVSDHSRFGNWKEFGRYLADLKRQADILERYGY